jgi:hypothetical protein
MGMNPHFEGRSAVRVVIEARIVRQAHTPLDGTFLAWANPPDDGTVGGDYPLAFDCPDAAVHENVELPVVTVAQIAAFAQQLSVYDSPSAYDAAAAAEGLPFPSRSFIPSGLVSPSGEPVTPPESHALMAGHVVEAAERRNSVTGEPFWWALLDSVGGAFDVVIDPSLITAPIRAGNVLSGWFWLSGRLRGSGTSPRGWFDRFRRRG